MAPNKYPIQKEAVSTNRPLKEKIFFFERL